MFDITKLQKGDVILSSPQSSWVSRGIRRYQKKLGFSHEAARFSHTAGFIGYGQFVNARFPRSRVEYLKQAYVDKGIPFVVLRPKGLTFDEREHLAFEWIKLNNIAYDWKSLFWWTIRVWSKRNWLSNEQRLICSELIAKGFYAIDKGGFVRFLPPENVVPAHYWWPEMFSLIYDGKEHFDVAETGTPPA